MRLSHLFGCSVLVLTVSVLGCRREPSVPSTPSPAPVAPVAPKAVSQPAPVPVLANYRPSPRQFEKAENAPTKVALTFDAGSDAVAVTSILKELQARNVHATFFLTGAFCKQFPQECRAIADAGMELGNHSYSHPHFTKLSAEKIRDQLERAEAMIVKTCGRGAKPLFRFPYGDCDRRTRQIVAEAGYQPIYWTLDTHDSLGKGRSQEYIEHRVLDRVEGGYIVLMHVSSQPSADALPRIFAHLDKMGAKVVPVSELMQPSSTESAPAH